jgi:hypothetical protein
MHATLFSAICTKEIYARLDTFRVQLINKLVTSLA